MARAARGQVGVEGGRVTPLPQPQAHPEAPGIPDDPAAAERARKAQANIAAKKPHDFKVTVDPDGSVIMTLDTGERVRLESA